MKNWMLIVTSLTLPLAMSGCASHSTLQPLPVVAACPALPPAPAQAMVKRQRLSPEALQQDLLGDTPTTTKSSMN